VTVTKKRPPGDYDVGYGKPPRKNQFLPGQSGNPAGRSRKRALESPTKTIERILSEVVEVGGRKMTKLELAIEATLTRTIKSGNMRDLERLTGMLGDLGIQAKLDWAAEQEQAANETMAKIALTMTRTLNIDPKDIAARMRSNAEEIAIVTNCSHCAPKLRSLWGDAEFQARSKRGVNSELYLQATNASRRKKWIGIWENTPGSRKKDSDG
jgi:hypothetical protein